MAVGLALAAAESLRPSLTPRSTTHQSITTGLMATTGAATGAAVGAVVGALTPRNRSPLVPATLAAAGATTAGWHARRLTAAQQDAHTEWGASSGRPLRAVTTGTAVALGVSLTADLAAETVRDGGRALAQRFGGAAGLWTPLLAGATTAGAATAARVAFRRVLAKLAEAGRAADKALAEPTADPFVSGGPGSAVPYDTLSREGRRFVAWRVRQADLASAGVADGTEPLRVYVGIDTAATAEDRVDVAMAELERLGAFDRGAILAASPAGSGYANSVPVEALEFFTAGDCASVCVQYGVLPSMFSFDALPLAERTFRLLLDRLVARIAQQPADRRPKLFLYGESLGAKAAERALLAAPSRVDLATAQVDGVTAALFVGTPAGESLRDDLLGNPAAVHVDRWQALADPWPSEVQLWFLDHDADPVTRFRASLAWQSPGWLAPPRGRNVPNAMRWLPVATWQQVLLDVAYATQAQSGVFRSLGHDYRADLPTLVAAAFAPAPADRIAAVQAALAERESVRDARLTAAETAG